MIDIIKQAQEAYAAVVVAEMENVQPNPYDSYNFAGHALSQVAAAIRALDLSHLTVPRCACGDSFTEDALCANCLAAKDSVSPLTGWQDISTAPKDFVTEFDGWNGERVTNVFWSIPDDSSSRTHSWCRREYVRDFGWCITEVHGLTLWHPIPANPKPSK